ncbi:MAG TPA: SBBP repeat-containing protein [Terriglobales bacterium]|nr:SBBP repeat-containing protein [Terriglobales bacterium]
MEAPRSKAVSRKALRNYARLPLSFEPNVGESNPEVKFLSRGQGYSLFLTGNRAVLQVRTHSAKSSASPTFHALALELLGANPGATISSCDRLPGVSNYLLGSNPAQWHTGVPHFARVHYRDIYPGVDLVYYGRRQQLEYDFVVAPKADPGHIRLRVEGARALSVDENGNLNLDLPGGAIQLRRPQVYQQIGKRKRPVAARYVLESGNRVAFALGSYDHRRALIIDPRLAYFSYLGGSGNDTAPAIAVDSAFNAYVAGTTSSPDFPTLSPYQGSLKGSTNIFVTKFNSAGTALVFSTYLGGTGTDTAAGIAVDAGFNIYVAGTTSSGDFPVTSGSAYQSSPKTPATNHVFVTELNSSGSGLVYSTYLSGSNADLASGVAVGPIAATVFVTGTTQSTDFANVTRPSNLTGSSEFFVAELNTGKQGAASRVYTTYVGGSTPFSGPAITNGGGIAVDHSGNAYITGGTNYTDMPVVNAPRFPNGNNGARLNGVENAFVAKLNPNGTLPALFLTYLGGNGTDIGAAISADSGGNAYVTGSTTSTNFPTVTATGGTLYQGALAGTTDAFVTKVASAGTSLIWSTYIGQSADTGGLGIAVDANQNSFVTGSTSGTVATVKPTQVASGGGTDAFVAEFDVTGTAQFVSYLGGAGTDRGTGIALDVNANPYVAGDTTSSSGLPVGPGAFQPALKGGTDAFVAHFAGVSTLAMTAAGTPDPVGIGNAVAFTFTITNQGPDIATAIVFTDTLPGNGTYQSAAPSQGTCSAPAGSTLACSLGQLAVNGSATVTVHIAPTTAGPLSDTGTLSSGSTTGSTTVGASVNVNDFAVAVSPATASTPAGQAATYTVTVGPLPQGAAFPNGINLKCSGGVPTAALCAFSSNPVTPNSTPVTSSLTISTTALPPGTTASLFERNLPRMYAVMLPLGGIAFLGFSLSGHGRRRKLAGILLLLVVLGLTMLQPACGSSSNKPTVPPFTPAGTYNITISAISGTGTGGATHTTKLTLVVK